MRKALTVFAAGMVALAGGACFSPSMATPVQILDPSQNSGNNVTLTDGNLLITVTSCHITIASSSAACGSGNNLYLGATNKFVNGSPVTTATIQSSVDGSTPIFNATAGDARTYDLSIVLSVQTINGAAGLNSVALAVNGTADPGNLAAIGTGETVKGQTNQILGIMNATAAGPTQQLSFAGQNKLTMIKDINDKTAGAAGSNPMILTSVSQSWGQAPEPASIALLLTGVAAVGALRLRRRRTA